MPRMLLVENQASERAKLSSLFGQEGFQVDVAENGGAALERVRQSPFDIALVDMKAPGTATQSFFRQLIERGRGMDTIALTSPTGRGAVKALEAGVYDLLQHPLTDARLTASVRRCLEKRRLENELAQARQRIVELERADLKPSPATAQGVVSRALLEAINSVFREALTCESEEDVARVCLATAERLTDSKFGFIGEVNASGRFDTLALSDPGWQQCRMPRSDAVRMIRDMEVRGIWGSVLKEERSAIINDPSLHAQSVGVPQGHPAITSFLGVPLKRGGKTIGLIALANKDGGYDQPDRHNVEALSTAFEEALTRKRIEEALARTNGLIEGVLDAIPDIIGIQNPDYTIVRYNRAGYEILDMTQDDVAGRKCYDLIGRDGVCEHCATAKALDTKQLAEVEKYVPEFGRHLLCRSNPILNEQGDVDLVVEQLQDITERKQAEEALRDYQSQLRSLATELALSGDRERRQIATELHDNVGQTLAVVKLRLGELGRTVPHHLTSHLGELASLVDDAIAETRSLTGQLSPPALWELGLEAAIESLCDQLGDRYSIECRFVDDGQDKPLKDEARAALYRATRELLMNIVKHAHAGSAAVRIGREQAHVWITVEDNGAGFELPPSPAAEGEFGLFSIRERLTHLGGSVSIESKPGQGTRVTMVAPLATDHPPREEE